MSFTATNLAANATTNIKNNPGLLHSIVINKIGASANTLKIYDGLDANGTLLGTMDTTIAAAPTRVYDTFFRTGLTIVIGTGTAADVTVCYS